MPGEDLDRRPEPGRHLGRDLGIAVGGGAAATVIGNSVGALSFGEALLYVGLPVLVLAVLYLVLRLVQAVREEYRGFRQWQRHVERDLRQRGPSDDPWKKNMESEFEHLLEFVLEMNSEARSSAAQRGDSRPSGEQTVPAAAGSHMLYAAAQNGWKRNQQRDGRIRFTRGDVVVEFDPRQDDPRQFARLFEDGKV